MGIAKRCAVIAVFAFMQVSLAVAQTPTYDLTKVPRFGVGDQLSCESTTTVLNLTSKADVGVIRDKSDVTKLNMILEILEVNASGQPELIRATIVNCRRKFSATTPPNQAFERDVELKNLSCIARRQGQRFVADTTVITSPDVKPLTASQIYQLKAVFNGEMDFPAFKESEMPLMPPAPIAVGQTWEVSKENLEKWKKDSPFGNGGPLDVVGAKLRLIDVDGNVARVDGSFELKPIKAGQFSKCDIHFVYQIDLKTGLWVGSSDSTSLQTQNAQATVTNQASSESVCSLKKGTAAPSSQPAGLNNLGWPKPPEDTNNYRNKSEGLSLQVPAEFQPEKTPAAGYVARFIAPDQSNLWITVTNQPFPVDLDDMSRYVTGNLKATGNTVTEEKQIVLPGNIPALLQVVTVPRGKAVAVSLIAVDGPRTVVVSAGGHANDPAFLEKVRKIVSSLRLYEPGSQ